MTKIPIDREVVERALRALALRRNAGNAAYDEQAKDAEAFLRAALDAPQPEPVASTLPGNLRKSLGPWCREVLLYSPDNMGDSHEHRVMLYLAPPAPAVPSQVEHRLRRMLCLVRHGHSAYMDDGEASDSSAHPSIDYLRDSLDEIEAKWRQRPAAPVVSDRMVEAACMAFSGAAYGNETARQAKVRSGAMAFALRAALAAKGE